MFTVFLLFFKYNVHTILSLAKRVTIMINDDLDKKLRLRQAKLIQQEQNHMVILKC